MKLKKLLAASVAAVAGFSLLLPLAACGGDDDGYVDNTGEELTVVESSEAAEKLSDIISTMQNSTNASLTISMTTSSGETMSYDVKLLKTGSNLYADEIISSDEESVKSYIRDGVFYYYNMSSSSSSRYGETYSYDTGTGFMIYDTIDNMYYNFWSADLDELCTEEILRAYYTDSVYESYVETYGEDYVKSMFKSRVTSGYTVYSARLWTARGFGSYTEILKEFQELMTTYGENISASASEHRYEATFDYKSTFGELNITYSISLTDGAALMTSDFTALDSLIDDEICYISQSSASNVSALDNGGTATFSIDGSGYLGSDYDEYYYGKSGYGDIYSSLIYAEYDGLIVPTTSYDPDSYPVFTDAEENKEHAEDTGYLLLTKSYYGDGISYVISTSLADVYSGTATSFDCSIYDIEKIYSLSSDWLYAYGILDSEDQINMNLFSLNSIEVYFSYIYTENEQTNDGYYNKTIRFETYVSCEF